MKLSAKETGLRVPANGHELASSVLHMQSAQPSPSVLSGSPGTESCQYVYPDDVAGAMHSTGTDGCGSSFSGYPEMLFRSQQEGRLLVPEDVLRYRVATWRI